MTKLTSKDISMVQDHYLDYPYPLRDPAEEKTRLLQMHGEYLAELNNHLYKGKESFQNKFRVLVAGGGTGDSSTFFGVQLKNTNAEVVYLDFSKNSMEIAKKRAEARGLKNITFLNDSIFNIPNLNLGKFDLIQCSGVLHHLTSPDEGLKILADSLKETGGMHLMVYAKYGRTGVYQMQELMRQINVGVTERAQELMNCKAMLASTPVTNWFARGKELIMDIHQGDVGIYDLLLHKQDRCYSIPEIYEFVKGAGLNFVEFSEINSKLKLRPQNYIRDLDLLRRIQSMTLEKQREICEIITGDIIKHSFYVSKQKDSIATFDDVDNVPYFFYAGENLPKQFYEYITSGNIAPGNVMNLTLNNGWLKDVTITLPVGDYSKHIFNIMKDGDHSIKEICDFVRKEMGKEVSDEAIITSMKGMFAPFVESGTMMLRDKSIKPFTFDIVA